MNRAIGITATVAIVAIGLWLFGPSPVSQAEQPTVAPAETTQASPSSDVTESGPRVLYFAPAEGRNIAADEGMIRLRRNGARVTYVTEMTGFILALATTWDMVVAVDIPESVLDNGVLAMVAEEGSVVMRFESDRDGSEEDARLVSFGGERVQDDSSSVGEDGPPATPAAINFYCGVEWGACLSQCTGAFGLTGDNKRACDQCCNNAGAVCEQGHPVSVNCVRVTKGQDPNPFAPKPAPPPQPIPQEQPDMGTLLGDRVR